MNEDTWPLALSPILTIWLLLALISAALPRLFDARWARWATWWAFRPLIPFALGAAATRLAGMLAGAFFYLFVGAFTHAHLSLWDRAAGGIMNGYLFGWMWSIGVGAVAAVMWLHKQHRLGRLPHQSDPSHTPAPEAPATA